MIVAALTGGIGAGKSEALEAFRRAGSGTVALDAIAHELADKGAPVWRAVVRAFGREVLDARGRLDRRRLAAEVFSRPALRRRLERVTHPLILKEMRRRLRALERAGARVAVVDVPLLYEAGLAPDFDLTVLVTAPLETRLARLRGRDGMSRADALRRVRAQRPQRRKEGLADAVIANGGSLSDLRRTVRGYQRALELLSSEKKPA